MIQLRYGSALARATRTRRRSVSRPGRRYGQALTEFALVAPVFLFVFFGIFQFSIFMAQHSALNFAVRDAVRAAAIHANETNTFGLNPGANGLSADDQVCLALRRSLASAATNPNNVQNVTIFLADGARGMNVARTDNPMAHDTGTCTSAGFSPTAPDSPVTLVSPPLTSVPVGCAGSASRTFPPCARSVIDPPDPVGVAVTYKFAFIIRLFGTGVTTTDAAILRIEPQCARGTAC